MGGWKEHHGWLVCGSWTAHLFSEMLPLSFKFLWMVLHKNYYFLNYLVFVIIVCIFVMVSSARTFSKKYTNIVKKEH
jgi:hypothetical protein